MREVPRYLQSTLCKSPASVRNTRFSGGEEDVRLQFQFVQDNQVKWMITNDLHGVILFNIFSTHHWLSLSFKRGHFLRRRKIRYPLFHFPMSQALRKVRHRSYTRLPSLKLPSTSPTYQLLPPRHQQQPEPPVLLQLLSLQQLGLSIINYLRLKSLKTKWMSSKKNTRGL